MSSWGTSRPPSNVLQKRCAHICSTSTKSGSYRHHNLLIRSAYDWSYKMDLPERCTTGRFGDKESGHLRILALRKRDLVAECAQYCIGAASCISTQTRSPSPSSSQSLQQVWQNSLFAKHRLCFGCLDAKHVVRYCS